MVQQMEHQAQTMKKRMDDIKNKFTYWDQFMETNTKSASNTLQEQTKTYYNHLKDQSTQLLEKFYQDTADQVKQKTQEIYGTLDNMAHNLYGSIEQLIKDKCDSAQHNLETVLQETYNIFQRTHDQKPVFPLRVNPRFSDARPVSSSPIKSRYNPYSSPNRDNYQHHQMDEFPPNQTQQPEPQKSDEEWSRYGPTDHDQSIEDFRPLPMLQAHKLVHHVKIPYPGKELTYTWYHTFRSAMKQYGILLIPVEEFKKGKSLCPRKYYGTKIDTQCYNEMADALYQLLILTDTITTEYTELRNILHRHASNTDGYSSLYEITERIHPLLNADAKLNAPLSINCTDIYDYINLLDSYFLHNRLEGIQFTARRQVNIFLNGLDSSYAAAISQIKQQMRSSWHEDDNTPPPDLTITSIARTIEQIMQDDTDQAVVRALARPNQPTNKPLRTRPAQPQPDAKTRSYVDVQCPYCKTYGHQGSNCDKMALFIILTEAITQLHEKAKSRLIGAYMRVVQDRRARRVNKIRSTVCQLYSSGNTKEGDSLWDQCMQHEEEQEASEASSSSSEEWQSGRVVIYQPSKISHLTNLTLHSMALTL
jgi:phage FluMu protein Com